MLRLLLCTPIFTLALLSVNSAVKTELGKKDKAPVKQMWSCPPGWSTYQSDTRRSCLFTSTEPNTYQLAKDKCHELGGFLVTIDDEEKRIVVKELAKNAGREIYWVSLYKQGGDNTVNTWQWHPSNTQCDYISASYDTLQKDRCYNPRYSICEQEVTCKPGYYGHMCDRECHCLRELCDQELENGPESLVCKYGCQTNWAGVACDIEKEDPEIKYYCINSAEHISKYVYIRIYTKGLQYRAIYGMTSNQVRGEWCNFTTTENESSDLTTIRIPVNNISMAQMSSGECAGQTISQPEYTPPPLQTTYVTWAWEAYISAANNRQLDEDTFSWSIALKEYGGYLQELDAQFKITCDFSVADNLERSGEFSLGREEIRVEENAIDPESVQDDVVLQLIDSSSGKSIRKAVIGTPVILEMKYALQQGSVLQGVLPHNCVVYTPDGKYLTQLLDENGCRVSNSPVESFRIEEDNKIRTPWFKLFTFENETSVTFRCAFDLCFTSDYNVGCKQKSRKRRDTQDVTDEVAHSTTRTIRVLPSIPAKGDSQAEDYQPARPPAAPPGYDLGPFVYLNPVTCSLFLLILLVFLCMYIAFIRTLRKSVYDIRKEIEVRRSRDKFLHCGCVQQKDRDYVAP